MTRLGFERKVGNHLQRDVRGWRNFDVHVSVYHKKGTFDELHVKFDRGPQGSAWFFFDTAGRQLAKTTPPARRKALLHAAGCPAVDLAQAFARMTEVAQDEANWVVSRLK